MHFKEICWKNESKNSKMCWPVRTQKTSNWLTNFLETKILKIDSSHKITRRWRGQNLNIFPKYLHRCNGRPPAARYAPQGRRLPLKSKVLDHHLRHICISSVRRESTASRRDAVTIPDLVESARTSAKQQKEERGRPGAGKRFNHAHLHTGANVNMKLWSC